MSAPRFAFVEPLEDRRFFSVAPVVTAEIAHSAIIVPARATTSNVLGTYTGTAGKHIQATFVITAQSKHGGFVGTLTVVTRQGTFHSQVVGQVTGINVAMTVTGDGTGNLIATVTSSHSIKTMSGSGALRAHGQVISGSFVVIT